MAIATTGLTRRFGAVTALDALTVELADSGVVGLLGPNGSGKSTLIRILLGLIPPTSGSAAVLGHSIQRPSAYAARVGALVEAPAFIPGLTARKNLLSLARLRSVPSHRVDEVLELVGLTARADDPVKRYSLGMKQRLGIAAALLPDPDLLILDEPTNGLDPAGIVEIRGLIRTLGSQGRTVLVSSHLLGEIEAVCDYLVILRYGVLEYAGPTRAFLADRVGQVLVEAEFAEQSDGLAQALAAAGWQVVPGTPLRIEASGDDAAQINRDATQAGITLSRLSVSDQSLEDAFLALTADRAGTGGGVQ